MDGTFICLEQALKSFEFAMKAEEVHARLYQEALDNVGETEEAFYYLCPVCGKRDHVCPAWRDITWQDPVDRSVRQLVFEPPASPA